jgi:hypothetical protein
MTNRQFNCTRELVSKIVSCQCLDLTARKEDGRFALYDGQKIVFDASSHDIVLLAQLLWHYGLDPVYLDFFIKDMLANFSRSVTSRCNEIMRLPSKCTITCRGYIKFVVVHALVCTSTKSSNTRSRQSMHCWRVCLRALLVCCTSRLLITLQTLATRRNSQVNWLLVLSTLTMVR